MLVTLLTPYADTTAADLSFALGLPAQPALHVLDLEAGDLRLQLRLLGASHQVLLAGPAPVSETVACLPDRPAHLPSTVDRAGYRFTARVHRLAPEALADRVNRLRYTAAADPHAVVGLFPGAEHAVTVLTAGLKRDGAGVAWRTWHAYPQAGELVETATEVRR